MCALYFYHFGFINKVVIINLIKPLLIKEMHAEKGVGIVSVTIDIVLIV